MHTSSNWKFRVVYFFAAACAGCSTASPPPVNAFDGGSDAAAASDDSSTSPVDAALPADDRGLADVTVPPDASRDDAFGGATDSAVPSAPVVIATRPLFGGMGGGRVDWCGDRIAFDRLTVENGYEIYTMRADGSDVRCVTCGVTIIRGIRRSQPAWHPGCEWIVFQSEDPSIVGTAGLDAPATRHYLGPAWGIHNELWLIRANGTDATHLNDIGPGQASLHGHISTDGARLFWTTRDGTGTAENRSRGFPFNGWCLSVADLSIGTVPSMGAAQRIYCDGEPNSRGFFESHALRDGMLWFSRTLAPTDGREQNTFVDEGFRAPLTNPSMLTNQTDGAGSWDEHVSLSPSGRWIAFMSSRASGVAYPPGDFSTLASELWIRPADLSRPATQLTNLRSLRTKQQVAEGVEMVATDFDWSPDGRQIALHVVQNDDGLARVLSLYMLDLDNAY